MKAILGSALFDALFAGFSVRIQHCMAGSLKSIRMHESEINHVVPG